MRFNLETNNQNTQRSWQNTQRSWQIAGIAALLILGGCSSQIKHLPDEANVSMPEAWEAQQAQDSSKAEDGSPSNVVVAGDVQAGWLNTFADDKLQRYVQIALDNNPDFLASAAQLKSAIEQVTVDGSALWPSLTTDVRKNRVETDTNDVTTVVRTVSASLDVSWEADVWGKLTQRKKSAALNAKAQAELFKAAELSLVANVSRAWFNLVTNKLQLDLAHQRLESFQRTADLIDENYKRGLRSALDVYLSRTDVQVQVAQLADTQFSYLQSLRTFKSLLGQYPDSDLEFEANLPVLSDPIPSGLPAELLTRRPDLQASLLQYQSAIAAAKAAHRDRFPSFAFSGSIGDIRNDFDKLFDDNNLVVTLVGGITQPIFRAGALKSREQQAVYQAETSYANMVRTTLNAFEEVENTLSREQSLQDQYTATTAAVGFAQGGLDLALDRYQSGIENYTTVLESQRRLFSSMLTEINLRNALLQNRIGIHLALGGDFTDTPGRDPVNNLPSISTASAEP